MDLHNNGRGRIIFLGDGTEPLNEGDEIEEDKDVDMQADGSELARTEEGRGEREETPGPEPLKELELQRNPESTETEKAGQSASTTQDKQHPMLATEIPIKSIPESALPDKLIPPPASQEK